MYQDHFGLHDDPFALGPNLRFLFRSRAHAETMAHLGYGLEQGEDIVLISGAIGTGKTLALHNLQAKISKLFRQVVVNVTQISFPEFLKLVLHELDETWPERADTADLLVCLKDRASAVRRDGRKILLVVDEAQNLNPETLEGIRLLTNIGQPDNQVFQIVLSGQPGLETRVNQPELAQLRQRVRIHYRLEPLSIEETGEYIAHRLAVAGREEPLFTANAVKKIHALSGGIPRLVNHLAGHALLVAFVDKDSKVDARHVAAEDMPETPAATADGSAMVEPRAIRAERSATEFDDDEEPALSAPKAKKSEPVFESEPAPEPEPEPEPEPVPEPEPEPAPRPQSKPDPTILPKRESKPGPKRDSEPLPTSRTDFMAPPPTSRERPALRPARPVAPVNRERRKPVWIWIASIAAAVVAVGIGGWALTRGDGAGAGETTPPAAIQPGDQASGPIDTPPQDPVAVIPAGGHWLHVASFRLQDRAERYSAILTAAGAGVQVRSATGSDGTMWRRVLVGPFAGEAPANAAATDLEAQGLITFHRLLAE